MVMTMALGCGGDDERQPSLVDAPTAIDVPFPVDGGPPDAPPCVSALTFAVIGTGHNLPRDVVVDDHDVYWSDWFTDLSRGGGRIYVAPKDGSAAAVVRSAVADVPDFDIGGLTLHAGALYWVDHRYVPTLGRAVDTIRTMPVAGGTPTDLATGQVIHFVVGDDGVYFASIDPVSGGGVIAHVPLGGGPVTTVGTSADQFTSLAADATTLFGATVADGIWRMDKRGGDPIIIAAGARGDVLVHGPDVYWLEAPTFAVRRVPKVGGPVTTLLDGGAAAFTRATFDGEALLLATDRTIGRLPLTGGPLEPLLCPADGADLDIGAIAVDATHVYVTYAQGQDASGVRRSPRAP